MLTRLLLDPLTPEGGATEPPAPEPKTEPPAPQTLSVPLSEHLAVQAKLREYEKSAADKAAVEKATREKELAEKGQYEKLAADRAAELEAERAKTASLEARTRTSLRDREIAIALAGHDLATQATAGQLAKLWADDFKTVADGDGWKVVDAAGRTPAQVIADRLKSDDYSPFVKAKSRGGAGGGGNTPAPSNTPGQAKVTGDAILDYVVAESAKQLGGRNAIGLAGRRK